MYSHLQQKGLMGQFYHWHCAYGLHKDEEEYVCYIMWSFAIPLPSMFNFINYLDMPQTPNKFSKCIWTHNAFYWYNEKLQMIYFLWVLWRVASKLKKNVGELHFPIIATYLYSTKIFKLINYFILAQDHHLSSGSSSGVIWIIVCSEPSESSSNLIKKNKLIKINYFIRACHVWIII